MLWLAFCCGDETLPQATWGRKLLFPLTAYNLSRTEVQTGTWRLELKLNHGEILIAGLFLLLAQFGFLHTLELSVLGCTARSGEFPHYTNQSGKRPMDCFNPIWPSHIF